MPRNGSGTYALPAGQPVVTGTVISSTTHNTLASDIADELTNSIDRDGQTVWTGDQDANGNAIILDADGDSKIECSTDDRLDVWLGGALKLSLTAAQAALVTDIAALTPTDGNFIVGNGTTWVAESGATLRTSIGVGTGNTPQFTNVRLTGIAAGHIVTGNSAGGLVGLDLTTKGGLIVGDGAGIPSVLGVGTNGHALIADSGEATGMKWGPIDGASSLSTSGYQVFPSGLIVQWGETASINRGSGGATTLPMTFPNAALQAVASQKSGDAVLQLYVTSISTSSISITGPMPSGATGGSFVARYIVIGY